MKRAVLVLAVMTATISAEGSALTVPAETIPAFTSGLAVEDTLCGDCSSMPYPVDPDLTVHYMSPGESVNCSGGGGHPTHDCVNGDGMGNYSMGDCEAHGSECSPLFVLDLLRTESGIITASAAAEAAAMYPTYVSYEADSGTVLLNDCGGELLGMLLVKADRRAETPRAFDVVQVVHPNPMGQNGSGRSFLSVGLGFSSVAKHERARQAAIG